MFNCQKLRGWCLFLCSILILHFVPVNAQTNKSIIEQLDNAKCKDSVFQLDDGIIDGKKFLRRAIYVDCPIENTWQLLLDPDEVNKTVPKLKKYEILETFSDSMILLCSSKPRWYLKTYTCTVSVILEPIKKIRWVQTGGDFKAMECSWELYSITPEKTVAIFSLHFKLGGVIPGFLVNWGINNGLPGMMVKVKEWLSGEDLSED